MIIIIFWMYLALFVSSQSVSFECEFSTTSFGTLGTVYRCNVQNSVNITSLDAAQIDSITGEHKSGYNNDYVEALTISQKGQINYFPRGLNKFFKNLKGIQFYTIGLKEIHQSDLKVFPKLMNLYLYYNNLEILQENLFEFNPNVEEINLSYNKITHIDSNVFDKLTKLKTFYLVSNTCINIKAENNPAEVQNVIRRAQLQCTNSDYSNLEQKVKDLEMETKNLNSENLKDKLKNLENEIKISKFSNFFQEKLQSLNVVLIEMEKNNNFFDKISALIKNCSFEKCSSLESKVNDANDKLMVQDIKISGIEKKLKDITDTVTMIDKNFRKFNKRFTSLMNALENAYSAGHQGT